MKEMVTTIYKAGTQIEIKLDKTKAVINGVKIENDIHITYIAAYAFDGEYIQGNFYEYEFDVIESKGKRTIGFK